MRFTVTQSKKGKDHTSVPPSVNPINSRPPNAAVLLYVRDPTHLNVPKIPDHPCHMSVLIPLTPVVCLLKSFFLDRIARPPGKNPQ